MGARGENKVQGEDVFPVSPANMEPFASLTLDPCRQTAAQSVDVVLTPLVVGKLKMCDYLKQIIFVDEQRSRVTDRYK